jgi:hypothetical protein
MRPTTLTVVPVESSADVRGVALRAAAARNVDSVLEPPEGSHEERLARAWREIERCHSTYVVTDCDTLRPLLEAWVSAWRNERLEDFEIAALAAKADPLPDFYLVLDAGEPDPDPHGERFLRREWFFGVLGSAAPARVVPIAPGADALASGERVLARLGALPAGAPLPPPRELVAHARKRVPGLK